jgi:cell wall-associated NlpC family hydrolase
MSDAPGPVQIDSYAKLLSIAREVAFSLLNKPYIWGGDNPVEGIDCSGLVIEILKSIGLLPSKGDWTAHGLYNRFKDHIINEQDVSEGCLIFWQNKDGTCNHVEYALSTTLSIGARGGGSQVKTTKDALKYGAYSKIRPWKGRPGRVVKAIIDPFSNP